jgi:hypothetical protein
MGRKALYISAFRPINDEEVGLLADEAEVLVAEEGAGEEARLAEDLEAVADSQHRAARGGKRAMAPARR